MTEKEILGWILMVLIGQSVLAWLGMFYLDNTLQKILQRLEG